MTSRPTAAELIELLGLTTEDIVALARARDAETEADYLTKAEAAKYAGFCTRTIERAIADRDLDASGGGGLHVRVKRSSIDAWMETRKRGRQRKPSEGPRSGTGD